MPLPCSTACSCPGSPAITTFALCCPARSWIAARCRMLSVLPSSTITSVRGSRRTDPVLILARNRVLFSESVTPALISTSVAACELATPMTVPMFCCHALAMAATVNVLPVPAGPTITSVRRPEVSTWNAAAAWSIRSPVCVRRVACRARPRVHAAPIQLAPQLPGQRRPFRGLQAAHAIADEGLVGQPEQQILPLLRCHGRELWTHCPAQVLHQVRPRPRAVPGLDSGQGLLDDLRRDTFRRRSARCVLSEVAHRLRDTGQFAADRRVPLRGQLVPVDLTVALGLARRQVRLVQDETHLARVRLAPVLLLPPACQPRSEEHTSELQSRP